MRDGFREIVSGWTLYTGTEDLDERLEHLARWAKDNWPLEEDEAKTVQLMIDCQIARKMFPETAPIRREEEEEEYE